MFLGLDFLELPTEKGIEHLLAQVAYGWLEGLVDRLAGLSHVFSSTLLL